MAMYWPAAGVAVESGEHRLKDARDYPPDTIVISMSKEQEQDKGFLEGVRQLICDRTLDRDDLGIQEGPSDCGGEPNEAERLFAEKLLAADDQDSGEFESYDDIRLSLGYPWEPWPTTGAIRMSDKGVVFVDIHGCDRVSITR